MKKKDLSVFWDSYCIYSIVQCVFVQHYSPTPSSVYSGLPSSNPNWTTNSFKQLFLSSDQRQLVPSRHHRFPSAHRPYQHSTFAFILFLSQTVRSQHHRSLLPSGHHLSRYLSIPFYFATHNSLFFHSIPNSSQHTNIITSPSTPSQFPNFYHHRVWVSSLPMHYRSCV